MRLPPEGARWFVRLRWLACAYVFAVTWTAHSIFGVIVNPVPLYVVGCVLAGYNLWFMFIQRNWDGREGNAERNIFWQIVLDLFTLTLLLYFADLPRNPFLFYFVFHMIIASMYLRGWTPYYAAGLATLLVGAAILLESFKTTLDWIPTFPMHFPSDAEPREPLDGMYLLGVFLAFSSTLWITVYFTIAIRHYADRAFAEIRQREKMLGIGQLVAGIAHQIANPLDGMQNCLHRIGERVQGDRQLSEYVELMTDALQRIERTAKRVQAFARPRGITLRSTDVNRAVQATLDVLGASHEPNIQITTELGDIPPVHGDIYTLQEVLFNLCTNALAAMPNGGTLTLRTRRLGRQDEDRADWVGVEVIDTGIGIPDSQLEKIFEPFYTTRADSGGTGMGLGLCRMLISEMGGWIEVRSALGEGTTFTVGLNPAESVKATAKE